MAYGLKASSCDPLTKRGHGGGDKTSYNESWLQIVADKHGVTQHQIAPQTYTYHWVIATLRIVHRRSLYREFPYKGLAAILEVTLNSVQYLLG